MTFEETVLTSRGYRGTGVQGYTLYSERSLDSLIENDRIKHFSTVFKLIIVFHFILISKQKEIETWDKLPYSSGHLVGHQFLKLLISGF